MEEAGIGGIDELQEKFVRCNGNADCERNARNEYHDKEKAAGEKLVALYQSGQLSKDEFNYLVTEYTTAMLSGIEKGEKLSDTGFDWIGDIYRLSGNDWTPMGEINNPYLNAIRSSELIADWKAQGMSDDKIQENILKDGTLGAVIAPIDVNNILKLVDNGANKEDLAKTATSIVLGKILQGKTNGAAGKQANDSKLEAEKNALNKIGENAKNTNDLSQKEANSVYNQQLIKNAEKISTAKPGQQTAVPRDLNEQTFWKSVQSKPLQGKELPGLNNDPRFPTSAGFQKMEAKHKLPDGQTITIHYQYNSTTGKAYDMKITTPQRIQQDPKQVVDTIKDKVK